MCVSSVSTRTRPRQPTPTFPSLYFSPAITGASPPSPLTSSSAAMFWSTSPNGRRFSPTYPVSPSREAASSSWHPICGTRPSWPSSILPAAWKRRILRLTMRINEEDVFPTHYRMNTVRILRSLARRWDFSVERLVTHEFEPCKYLDDFTLGFAAFYAYFRCMALTGLGRFFGASILAEFRKPRRRPELTPSTVKVIVKVTHSEPATAWLLPARFSR